MESWLGRQLQDLTWHWGSAFDITVNGAGTLWEAEPREGGTALTAGSHRELLEAMRSDYWRRTHVRAVPAGRR